jgi:hypothetical protein
MDELARFLAEATENGGSTRDKRNTPYFWQGGAAGAGQDWNEPLNWANRKVPGWFDTVVIDRDYVRSDQFPLIDEFASDVAQVILHSGTTLHIGPQGKICIDGLNRYPCGIINHGDLVIDGELTVLRTTSVAIRNLHYLLNNGSLAVDKKEHLAIIHGNNAIFENYGELLFF